MALPTRTLFFFFVALAVASHLPSAFSLTTRQAETNSLDASASASDVTAAATTDSQRGGSPSATYVQVCAQIKASMSSASAVYYPGDPVFKWLSSHWAATSTQTSACVVEPRSAVDVGKILQLVGRYRTPFAVEGGGHATNPGFSSTPGVHISLNSFKSITYNAASQTVEFGAGLSWNEVYTALEPHGVSVVGGRALGPGVAGFTLGGGYSFKTNQYGLTVDSVVKFELVKPNGQVVGVTQNSDSGLFFALKGAGNNFGIVTKFTLKTVPQGPIWGGIVTYMDPTSLAAINLATSKFSTQSTDPKAAMLSTTAYYQGMPLTSVQLFYDGPNPPAGIFDDFLSTPSVQSDVGTRSYLSFYKQSPSNDTYGMRNYFHTVPIAKYTPKIMRLISNLTVAYGNELASKSLVFMTLVAEPFLPTILTHSTSPSAYPFTRAKAYTPFQIFLSWSDPAQDAVFESALKRISDAMYAGLVSEGQADSLLAPMYGNYAWGGTSVARIYGTNLVPLKVVKLRVDPTDVMGLAGGFKV
ncbi:hypothetical protein D9611_000612 [Ephemerocybe angulata]|uniref:FAD-binding PCMH-type domain-containing protein n=1 Tax=Ephemerocybe angulata TaxID=980116 RepID=A0A8H5BN03_9AGAR|nr:hypothetical protein D9611_000612 [Tulosesus angulatus]